MDIVEVVCRMFVFRTRPNMGDSVWVEFLLSSKYPSLHWLSLLNKSFSSLYSFPLIPSVLLITVPLFLIVDLYHLLGLLLFLLCSKILGSDWIELSFPSSLSPDYEGACSPFCLAGHRKIIHMTLSIRGKRVVFMMGKNLSIVGKFALMAGKFC